MTDATTTKPAKTKETTGEMIRSVIFMVFLALVFRSLAYEPFHIPSGSMLSTLYEGDYIFVSKASYGYSRFSFPFAPKLFEGRVWETLPERGDVVVFRNPANTKIDYIKRVVGLPGETVQMKQGRLYINDVMVDQTRRGVVTLPNVCGEEQPFARYDETLPGGKTHIVLDDLELNKPITPEGSLRQDCIEMKKIKAQRGHFNPDNTPVYVVPEGHYFMMGDNRDHSQDSRYSADFGYEDAPGFVPFENMIGRAEVIAFSWKHFTGRWAKAID